MLPIAYSVALPVSHHFADEAVARRVCDCADALELRDNDIDPPAVDTSLYHADVDAALEWDDADRERLAAVQTTADPDLVSVHLGRRYQEADVVDGQYVGVGDPYDRSQLRSNVARNVGTLRAVFPDVPLLVENNNHLGTDAYDVVTDPSFVETIVRENDVDLLLDVAHAKITAHNTDVDPETYVAALPLDRCRQVHLSRLRLGEDYAVDAHAFLREEDWRYFDALQRRLPNLTYVTLEYYEDATVLLDQLTRMQRGESEVVLTPEPWDSEFFERSIASLTADPVTPECLDYAVVRSRERGVECLYFETGGEGERDAALARGFDLVDTTVTFARDLTDDGSEEPDSTVRPWREADRPRLRRIAGRVFEGTRFYTDETFDTERCNELYATWIDNACDGYADEVLVATNADEPVGFITCTVSEGRGEIGLVGVARGAQGQGIGSDLVAAAIDWFRDRGASLVTVDTQADNESAKHLYRRAGFSTHRQSYVFHYWVDDRSA